MKCEVGFVPTSNFYCLYIITLIIWKGEGAHMEKGIEEMFKDLLTLDNVGDYLGSGRGRDYDYSDDEDIVTSKEEVKLQKESEERFGLKADSRSEIDETVEFRRYTPKRVHKYTEKGMQEIRESNKRTIVNDYGYNDIYHISDEDRLKNDMLAEFRMKLGGIRSTYRKVDQYIQAMRIVIEAWKILEKQGNYIHEPDEFFTMVGNGEIVSSSIIMPKLKGIDNYSIDQIIKYISNPELDPADLIHSNKSTGSYDPDNDFIEDRPEYEVYYNEYMDNLTDEDKEDMDEYDIRFKADEYAKEKIQEDEAMRLLSPEEADYLVQYIDNPPDIKVTEIPRKYIKGYDQRSTIRKAKGKKLNKRDRVIQKDVHDMLIKLQNDPANRNIDEYNRSYMITHGMFDTEKKPKDFWDDLVFDGSWADDAAVYMYDLISREELLKMRAPDERYMTYGDIELNSFFQIAERNGINVIELRQKMEISDNTTLRESVELRESTKESKKLERDIIQRITKLNNDPKFKKLVDKSERALNKYYDNE